MRFRPNERVSPEVVANIGAEMSGKMVTALVISAGGEAASKIGSVEAQVLAADSSHHIATKFLAQLAPVNCIHVIKNGAIRRLKQKIGTRLCVECLMCSPRDLAAETDVMLQNEEAAETGIEPSTHRGKCCAGAVGRRSWSFHRAEAKSSVKFLGLCS